MDIKFRVDGTMFFLSSHFIVSWYVTAFKIFSLSLTFSSLNRMCLDVVCFLLIMLGFAKLLNSQFYVFLQICEIFGHYSSNIFLILLLLLEFYTYILDIFIFSDKSLRLCLIVFLSVLKIG